MNVSEQFCNAAADKLQDKDEKILKQYFRKGLQGALDSYPVRERNKLPVLREILKRFDSERVYSEKEVNLILSPIYHDFFLLRRELVDYKLLERKRDGSQYWVKKKNNYLEES